MKKLYLAPLALLLLLSVASCGDKKPEPHDTETQTQAESSGVEPTVKRIDCIGSLTDLDFGGQTLNIDISVDDILSVYKTYEYLMGSENSGDDVRDMAVRRNAEIEEALNVHVNWIPVNTSYDMVEEHVTKIAMSGEGSVDLFVNDQHKLFLTAVKGCILNVEELDDVYYDFTAKGWQNEYMEKASVLPGSRYLLVSDFFLDSIASAHVTYVNKDIINSRFEGMDELYTLVEDGKWTIDVYGNYIKNCYEDLSGDGQINDGDLFGLRATHLWAGHEYYVSSDCRSVSWDSEGKPYLDPTISRISDLTDRMLGIFSSNGYFYSASNKDFYTGNVLFSGWMQLNDFESAEMRNMNSVGIIPYPKFDEAQERYITSLDSTAEIGAISVSAPLESMPALSAYLQAQTVYTSEYIVPAYYETALKVKYAHDNQSARMLDIIRDGIVVPYENLLNLYTREAGMNALVQSLAEKHNIVSSYIESNYKAEEAKLANLINALEAFG